MDGQVFDVREIATRFKGLSFRTHVERVQRKKKRRQRKKATETKTR